LWCQRRIGWKATLSHILVATDHLSSRFRCGFAGNLNHRRTKCVSASDSHHK
jgi:hypothetical protein